MSKNPEKKAESESVVQEQDGGLLNKILESGRLALREDQVDNAKDMLAEFVQQALQGQVVLSKDLEHTINARIAAIDKLLSAQLNEVMHHPDFQKLEGSWRGLRHLVFESETSTMLKIRVLNVSKKDLLKDLERAAEFDQSALFKKVYEEEYGTFGGAPFGALIGDYEFGNHPQDMSLLEKISGVAAAANAPFISAASPEMFGWQTYHRADRGARPRQDLRSDRVCEVALVPRFGGLALRGTHPPPHSHASPVRHEHRPRRDLQFRGGRGRQGPQEVPLGQRRLFVWDAPDRGLRPLQLDRRDPRRGGGRARTGASGSHLPDRRRRRGAEVPDRDLDHRSPREGVFGPRFPLARSLQEHRLRGVLRRAVGPEGQEVRHRFRERERASLDAAALHLRRVPFRPLPQDDHAGQDRQLRVAQGRGILPQQVDLELRHARRHGLADPSRRSSPFARPASRWRKFRASPASTRRSPSSGRTSSSTSCRSPCGWWRSCRLRRGGNGTGRPKAGESSPASAPAPSTHHAEDRRGDPDQPVGPRPARRLRARGRKPEPLPSRSKALRQVKQALRRDLEWLLNTRRVLEVPEELPFVSDSILAYGLPDLSELERERRRGPARPHARARRPRSSGSSPASRTSSSAVANASCSSAPSASRSRRGCASIRSPSRSRSTRLFSSGAATSRSRATDAQRLLEYYERELSFLRQMGAEFAEKYPKVASRLQLEPDKCEDPHVERLLEAFAFLAARVRLKIDDEFPEITESLLGILYPRFSRPCPRCPWSSSSSIPSR